MQDDLISRIKLASNTFTNAEKKIAEYILNKPSAVLYMSITDLANACGVGDTSVFRFCKHLDKKGYMDFKMDLAQTLSLRDEPNESENLGILDNNSISVIAQKSLVSSIDVLRETLKINNLELIEKVIDLMLKAKRIFFFGSGSSMASAYEAQCRFMRISPKGFTAFDAHLQAMSAALLGPDDVAVAFSYSGATKDTIYTSQVAKNAGAKLISLTRFANSQLTRISDVVLLCGANEDPLQGGSLSVKISQLYLLDLLYISYANKNKKESMANRKRTMYSISEKLM